MMKCTLPPRRTFPRRPPRRSFWDSCINMRPGVSPGPFLLPAIPAMKGTANREGAAVTTLVTAFTPLSGLLGGVLIGLSAVVLMAGLGRIAGISGIVGGLVGGAWLEGRGWRWLFVAGLLAGSTIVVLLGGFDPSTMTYSGDLSRIALGGLLVGAGTAMAAGCTSGHGICGLSRLSPRSLVATPIFMAMAIITVFITRYTSGG